MHRIHQIALVIVSLIIGTLIGRYEGSSEAEASIAQVPDGDLLETRNRGDFRFINPLLECELAAPTPRNPVKRLEDGLRSYIDNVLRDERIDQVSVYYRDLTNGPWTGIDYDQLFAPASLLKVPVVIAALRKAEGDPGLLDREFEFDATVPRDTSNPVFVSDQIVFGESYTYRDLMERAIVHSDNNAANMLLNIVSDEDFFKVWMDFGIGVPISDTSSDILTVKEYAAFFRILYNGTYLSRGMSELALEMLSRSSFDIGLQAGIPRNVALSSKFGERYIIGSEAKQLHDCGIVYAEGAPYLICVMTRGRDWDTQVDIIAELSRMVYEFQVRPSTAG